MRPRIHVITLAVADLERALEFYRGGLGLESPGVIGTEFTGNDTNPAGAVVMFQLQGGLILALYPRTELAKDANILPGPPQAGEFSIGHAVASKADVDSLLDRAEKAGATLTDKPHDRPWAFTPGTSATWTAISGRSCGIPSLTRRPFENERSRGRKTSSFRSLTEQDHERRRVVPHFAYPFVFACRSGEFSRWSLGYRVSTGGGKARV